MTTLGELKPCPFCGDRPNAGSDKRGVWASCPTCGICRDIDLWNRRPLEDRWRAEALAARAATKQFLYWDGTKLIPFRGFVSGEEEEKYSAARAAGVTGVTIGYVKSATRRKERNAWKAEALAARVLLMRCGTAVNWDEYICPDGAQEAYASARAANGEE